MSCLGQAAWHLEVGTSSTLLPLGMSVAAKYRIATMATNVSIWRVSLMAWAVVAAVNIHTALCDPSASWDPNAVWNFVAIACGCLQGAVGMWVLAITLHKPISGLYLTSYHRSCLPSSSLDFFHSSFLQHVLRNDGLTKVSVGLPLEGLDLFHHSCVQHSLRHPEGSLSGASLPTTALDWFHFSAMRRLLHNSGKCLMSEAALDIFVQSLIQQAMASELETSFEATSRQDDNPGPSVVETSAKNSFISKVTSRFSLTASSLSTAVQHHIAGPPFSSSSSSPSMPSAIGAFTTSSPHDAEAGSSMGSDAFDSNAGIDGNANPPTEKTFLFSSAPMLGSPVQFNGQPVSRDVAAEAENIEGTLEQQALQPYSIPLNFSIVAATVRKEALTRLISNSMCLAAAIEEAGEPAVETFAPESGGEVNLMKKISLKRMGSSVKEFAIKAFQGPERQRLLAA